MCSVNNTNPPASQLFNNPSLPRSIKPGVRIKKMLWSSRFSSSASNSLNRHACLCHAQSFKHPETSRRETSKEKKREKKQGRNESATCPLQMKAAPSLDCLVHISHVRSVLPSLVAYQAKKKKNPKKTTQQSRWPSLHTPLDNILVHLMVDGPTYSEVLIHKYMWHTVKHSCTYLSQVETGQPGRQPTSLSPCHLLLSVSVTTGGNGKTAHASVLHASRIYIAVTSLCGREFSRASVHTRQVSTAVETL